MRQIIHLAINNFRNAKFKAIIIILLLVIAIFTSVVSYSFAKMLSNSVNAMIDDMDAAAKVTIATKDFTGTIPKATLHHISELEGVRSVIPQYNIAGLLEESEGVPIYLVDVNGFDFDTNILIGASDYRGMDISGVILPDISVDLFGRDRNLENYVGSTIYFTYDYVKEGKYLSKTKSCDVVGLYKTKGVFEENPVYMSMDLFSGILADFSNTNVGVQRAWVYLDNVDYIRTIAENIGTLGLEVFFESTLQDYKNTLKGFIKFSTTIVGLIIFFTIVIITQTILSNLKRRNAIIGVLKAHGYSTFMISFMIWLETLMYSVVAMIASALLCLFLGTHISGFLEQFVENIGFSFDITGALIILAIGVLTSGVSAIIPIVRLKKINPIDVLKTD